MNRSIQMKNVLILCCVLFFMTSCKSGKEKLKEQIAINEQKLYADSTGMLNITVAGEVLNSYTEFTAKYPEDTLSAAYLFKAADLNNGLRKYKEAVDLYGQFREKYRNHKKIPAALFMQAFIYDNNIRDKEKAKQLYTEFLQKYPGHELYPSAKASLDQINMGLSDEELIKLFESRRDSIAKNN